MSSAPSSGLNSIVEISLPDEGQKEILEGSHGFAHIARRYASRIGVSSPLCKRQRNQTTRHVVCKSDPIGCTPTLIKAPADKELENVTCIFYYRDVKTISRQLD